MAPNIPGSGAAVKNEKSLFARLGERTARLFARREARARADIKAGYPKTGTGKRQGERLARQQRNWMLDFSASCKCLAAIEHRQGNRTVKVGP